MRAFRDGSHDALAAAASAAGRDSSVAAARLAAAAARDAAALAVAIGAPSTEVCGGGGGARRTRAPLTRLAPMFAPSRHYKCSRAQRATLPNSCVCGRGSVFACARATMRSLARPRAPQRAMGAGVPSGLGEATLSSLRVAAEAAARDTDAAASWRAFVGDGSAFARAVAAGVARGVISEWCVPQRCRLTVILQHVKHVRRLSRMGAASGRRFLTSSGARMRSTGSL